MGNCCSADYREPDTPLNLKNGEVVKEDFEKHKPTSKTTFPTSSLNVISYKGIQTEQKMDLYNPGKPHRKSFVMYPDGGPYRDESTGTTYKGQYRRGLPHGFGLEILSTGEAYQGYFENGKRAGSGRTIYQNGDCFDGTIVNGKREGFGIYRKADNTYYKGNFLSDKYEGIGKLYTNLTYLGELTFPNGDYYNGNFSAGVY